MKTHIDYTPPVEQDSTQQASQDAHTVTQENLQEVGDTHEVNQSTRQVSRDSVRQYRIDMQRLKNIAKLIQQFSTQLTSQSDTQQQASDIQNAPSYPATQTNPLTILPSKDLQYPPVIAFIREYLGDMPKQLAKQMDDAYLAGVTWQHYGMLTDYLTNKYANHKYTYSTNHQTNQQTNHQTSFSQHKGLPGFAESVQVRVFQPSLDEPPFNGLNSQQQNNQNIQNSQNSIVQIVVDDRPFLSETVLMTLADAGVQVIHVHHTLVAVNVAEVASLENSDDASNSQNQQLQHKVRLQAIDNVNVTPQAATQENTLQAVALMYVAITSQSAERLLEIEQILLKKLAVLDAAVEDGQPIQDKLIELRLNIEQAVKAQNSSDGKTSTSSANSTNSIKSAQAVVNFLSWMLAGNFIFLGYRAYHLADDNRNTSKTDGSDTNSNASINKEKGSKEQSCTGLQEVQGSHLGILKNMALFTDMTSVFGIKTDDVCPLLTPHSSHNLHNTHSFHKLANSPLNGLADALSLCKSRQLSPVYANDYIDCVRIPQFNQQGECIGEQHFFGLLTNKAHAVDVWQIPLVSEKIAQLLAMSNLPQNSHAHQKMQYIVSSLPKNELLQLDVDELYQRVSALAHWYEPKLRLFVRVDEQQGFAYCSVYVPHDKYTTKLELEIQQQLIANFGGADALASSNKYPAATLGKTLDKKFAKTFDSTMSRHYVSGIDAKMQQVCLYFTIKLPINSTTVKSVNSEQLATQLNQLLLTWDEKFATQLHGVMSTALAKRVITKYDAAIPTAYKQHFDAATMVDDVKCLSILSDKRSTLWRIQTNNLHDLPLQNQHKQLQLKMYSKLPTVLTSQVLAMLEDFGLSIIASNRYPFNFTAQPQNQNEVQVSQVSVDTVNPTKTTKHTLWLQVYDVMLPDIPAKQGLPDLVSRLEQSLKLIGYGGMKGVIESDKLNRLILLTQLNIHDVLIVRGLTRYMQQVNAPFNQAVVIKTLLIHCSLTEQLLDFFHARMQHKTLANTDTLVNAGKLVNTHTTDVTDPASNINTSNNDTSNITNAVTTNDIAKMEAKVTTELAGITVMEEQHVMQWLFGLMKAVVYSNAHGLATANQHSKSADMLTLAQGLSFKFDSQAVNQLFNLRPMFEVYEYLPKQASNGVW